MTDPVLISSLTPRNLLSFAPSFGGVALRALNLFIGPNSSGKSNLIEAVNLMRSAPRELRDITRKGGGAPEWIWKGQPREPASMEVVVQNPTGPIPIRHVISFQSVSQSFALHDERVEEVERRNSGEDDVYFYYRYHNGQPVINTQHGLKRGLARETIESDKSILAQRRDPETYPELAWLAQNYEKVRIYREWSFGRNAVFREPQRADMRNDVLEEDFSNLGLFLNRLSTRFPDAKASMIEALKDL